jgi:hypothetical protein
MTMTWSSTAARFHKRKKTPSKKVREKFRHTLSLEERIPWKCETEAKRRKVEVLMLPTPRAIRVLEEKAKTTNAFRT